jgi:polar amino acid transport system substrate-binding protein
MTDDLNFTRRIGFAGLGAVGVAALMTRSAAAQGTGGIMDRIISEKKFKIGYIPSPPSVIKDPASGELKGFAIDAVRFICKTLSVEPVFVETTWANFVSGLNSNQFDLSIAGTFATILRAGAVQFTKPIWYLGYSAVGKKGETRFAKPADLNKEGIRIALIQGGASVEYAKENWPKAEHVLLSTGNLTAPFVEVAAGRVDVGVEDAWQARRFAAAQPGVTDLFGSEPYNVLPINWAVKRGNQDVVEFMNVAIDFLMTTGRWEKMAEPYGPSGRYYVKPQLSVFGPPA